MKNDSGDQKKEQKPKTSAHSAFRAFAQCTASAMGSPWAFIVAALAIVVWILCGPAAHYSDTWQLVINTSTTIVTFLMVFLIQNTQNRDARAMHLKLDELIRGVTGARTRLVDLQNLSDEELDRLQHEFEKLRKKNADAPATAKALENVQEHVESEKDKRTGESPNSDPADRNAAWRNKRAGGSKSLPI